jgi:hypothetical protein
MRLSWQKVAPHPEKLLTFHDQCAKSMLEFEDWAITPISAK